MPTPRSTSRKLTAVAALVLASAGLVVGQKAYESVGRPVRRERLLVARPADRARLNAQHGSASADGAGNRGGSAPLVPARRHAQRRQLPESDRRLRRRPGDHRRADPERTGVCPRQRPQSLDRRRPAQHGRPRLRPERPRPGHDPLQRDVAQPRHPRPDRPERRHLARHPELPPPDVRRQGDAVHRHLHRRRLDRRQRPRDGPPGRLGRQHDPLDARHAAGRLDPARQPDREPGAVQPGRRRLRPVRHRAGRRARRGRQRHLHHRAPGDRLPGVPGPVRHRARQRHVARPVLRPPLDVAGLAAPGDDPLHLPRGRARPRRPPAARRGLRHQAPATAAQRSPSAATSRCGSSGSPRSTSSR